MSNESYKLPSGDLASRKNALTERNAISNLICKGNTVFIDCSDVLSMSESYADEVFGVLVLRFSLQKILAEVKLLNAKPFVLKSVAEVMRRRERERAEKSRGYYRECASQYVTS